jgi:hypothetical protein
VTTARFSLQASRARRNGTLRFQSNAAPETINGIANRATRRARPNGRGARRRSALRDRRGYAPAGAAAFRDRSSTVGPKDGSAHSATKRFIRRAARLAAARFGVWAFPQTRTRACSALAPGRLCGRLTSSRPVSRPRKVHDLTGYSKRPPSSSTRCASPARLYEPKKSNLTAPKSSPPCDSLSRTLYSASPALAAEQRSYLVEIILNYAFGRRSTPSV